MAPKKPSTTTTKAKATATTKTKATASAKTKAPVATKTKAPPAKVTKKAPAKKSTAKTASAKAKLASAITKATTATAKITSAASKASSTAAKKGKATASGKSAAPPAPAKPAANSSKKRKSTEDDSTAQAPAAPARPIKKARVTPKKTVINKAPTTKLNVYVFGEGSSGELGLGTAKKAMDVKRPRLNPYLSADTVGVVQIAVGGMHCAALTRDNKILTWGVNDQGALGRDTTWDGGMKDMDDDKSDASEESDSGLNPKESIPTAIPTDAFPEDTVFVEVAAGDSATFALTDDGNVYGWGTFRVSPPHNKLCLHHKLTSSLRTTKAF